MMRPANTLSEIYLCQQPVDFRKGINGLVAYSGPHIPDNGLSCCQR